MDNKKINELLADHQELHSEFQIKNFIIGSQGDNWAQYKQCLREIKARRESLSENYVKLEIIKRKKINGFLLLPTKKNKIKRNVFKIAKDKEAAAVESKIKESERELNCFVNIAIKLKKQIGEVTLERRQHLELKSWTAKGRRMAAIDQILTGRISHQTFEFILSLPIESQNSILDKILPDNKQIKLLIENFDTKQGIKKGNIDGVQNSSMGAG